MADKEAHSLYKVVTEGFEALGAANPRATRRAILYRGLTFAGQKFQCAGMRAVWLTGEETVAFYGAQGELLRTVGFDQQGMKKAA